jgi:hypothetical protein
MTQAITVPNLATDPGYLFWAPLSSTVPVNTVAASVFTDAWNAAFILLGATKEGSEFNWQTQTDTIDCAEFLDHLRYVDTSREGTVKFELMTLSAANVKKMLNGGTIVPTGSGATLSSVYTPPLLGASVRCMLGWESQDATERFVWNQCYQTGQLTISRKKGADNATLPVEFSIEVPTSGIPFTYATAGAARA